MSYEMIAVTMFAAMMVLLFSGQRVFGAIGFVAVIAALALLPVVLILQLRFPRDAKTWVLFAATGLLYNAFPFTLIS